MKGSERHRLKDNDLATLAQNVQRAVESRGREVTGILVGVAVVLAAILGYVAWQSRVEGRAASALADAMAALDTPIVPQETQNPPPGPSFATASERDEAALARFKAVADDYGSTDAGQLARYRQGALLLALNRPKEAVEAFRQATDDANSEILTQMARLGLAEAHAKAGEYDQAVSVYQELTSNANSPLPIEGVLMQLARTYLSAGRIDEARQTFARVVEEFSSSPYRSEAQRELDLLERS